MSQGLTPPGPERLTAELRGRARELGFDAVAVAAAGPLERDGDALAEWLALGRHAGMGWMARTPERRADPRTLLAGCKSVISVAMNYGPGSEADGDGDGEGAPRPAGRTGRVARYARGRDYHRVLGGKVKALAIWLEQASGEPARSFVDTGPVLERAWAERAGLGWIGKNANLLTRDLGSWLLLGELLSAAQLAPDAGPHADFCGSCTACLDACPTAAIVAPGAIDSGRCISYWTIEHRGPIPADRRATLGEWMFGCDICQEVCPWNERFGRPPDGDPFERRDREDLAALDPAEILAMDERTFRARFSGTALMRARWDGMRRNACILLGNEGDAAALPALAVALDDPDPLIRSHAAWAAGRIGTPRALELLAFARPREEAPEVRDEIDRAIADATRKLELGEFPAW